MHMSDALVSPVVAGTFWAVSGTVLALSAAAVRKDAGEKKVPLMAVLGAFVFAAQMINFSIPGTGSSGHLGGGLLLSVLLGPSAGFLVMTSILVLQALFFADGGLLGLGCNIFNLGFLTSFVAYPLIYKPLAGSRPSAGRLLAASLTASVLGLQAGSLLVTLQTVVSGVTRLPFSVFLGLMQGIHLAIGVVEGLVTFAVLKFVFAARPELLEASRTGRRSLKPLLAGLMVVSLLTAGVIAWFASSHPDGLEWSVERAGVHAGEEQTEAGGGLRAWAAGIQEKISIFPDYGFRKAEDAEGTRAEGSAAGAAGVGLTLGFVALSGILLRLSRRKSSGKTE